MPDQSSQKHGEACAMCRDNRSAAINVRILLGLALLIFTMPAIADPVEDMKLGEEAFSRADIVTAIAWFRKAAEADYAPAQARLAGLLNYSENDKEAVIWYQKAAEQNNADGQFGLGSMYANGEGVEQNYQQAVIFFVLAADQGHTQAIRALVSAYEKGGLGLEVDTSKAVEILNKAASNNDNWAITHLKNNYKSNINTGNKDEN